MNSQHCPEMIDGTVIEKSREHRLCCKSKSKYELTFDLRGFSGRVIFVNFLMCALMRIQSGSMGKVIWFSMQFHSILSGIWYVPNQWHPHNMPYTDALKRPPKTNSIQNIDSCSLKFLKFEAKTCKDLPIKYQSWFHFQKISE